MSGQPRRLALVDGVAFEAQVGYPLAPRPGMTPLLDPQGPDAELCAAGGWLVEPARAGAHWQGGLREDALCWIEAEAETAAVLNHLRQHLDVALPGGRTALLRFYDPRVLAALAEVLDHAQWAALCGPILRWRVSLYGEPRTFERPDAAAL
jgi:Domain of unknown function (DUF4123)